VSIRLDTDEGECVNAVDVSLTYEDGVRPIDIIRADSILTIWLEEPVIHENEKKITFAGGIVGGYCGRALGDPSLSNVLASIVFQSPGFAIGGGTNTEPHIRFEESTSVLLNDGLGTEAPLRTDGARLTLESTPGDTIHNEWNTMVGEDIVPPSDFVVTLAQSENAFGGQYFVTWNSIDKQTGIATYEIMEEPLEDLYAFEWGRADAPWKVAESPYVLTDQTLNSTIRIKAVDKAGNETIAVLIPDEALRSMSRNRMMTLSMIGIVAFVFIVGIVWVLFERKRRLSTLHEQSSSYEK